MGKITVDKILVTGRLYKQLQQYLSNRISKQMRFLPEEEVTEEDLKWADAYVAFRPTKSFDFYNIKWVHALGAGVDSFLFDREWKKDVILTRTICSFGTRISEYCISYILAELQHHRQFQKYQQEKVWEPLEPVLLSEQKILILGTGVIGQELAKSLCGLGVRPAGVSQSGEQKQYFEKVIKIQDIKGLLPEVNWMINTLPLTKNTEKLIDGEILQLMNNACLINVGRGRALDEKALITALERGNLKKAVLDVFSFEPLPAESELWSNSKVVVTPHIAAVTSVEEAAICFLDTLNNIETDKFTLSNLVDVNRGY